MAGRQWHWIAAGMAAVAVFVAVLLNDTTSSNIFRAQPFTTIDHTPEVGEPILATPTVDATTVPPAPRTTQPQPQQPVRQTPPAAPPPSTAAEPNLPVKPPKITLTLTLPEIPVFFPDCETAWFFGAAPIEKGKPGYRKELDRDRDGVACEPR
jgi:outer membrane biosynthesis protein TonB